MKRRAPPSTHKVANAFQSALNHHKQGATQQAKAGYEHVLKQYPMHAPSMHLLGLILKEEGDRASFYRLTEQSLKEMPTYAVGWCNLANAFREESRLDESEAAARKALAIDASLAEAWNTLGLVQHQRGQYAQALEHLNRALQLVPASLDFQSNYATALHAAGEDKEAEVWYRRVLDADPARPRTCNNYGVMVKDRARTQDAIALYRAAVQRDPHYSDAHWNLALALLSTHQYKEGWSEYEWRWTRSDTIERKPDHPFKELQPDDEWRGNKLFIYGEQGMGDTLQFYRFAIEMSRYAHVCLAPQKGLIPLLKGQDYPNLEIVSLEAVPADCQFGLALMSIPYLMPPIAETPSYPGPYLHAEPVRLQKTASVFEPDRLNIGLCWQGSKNKIDKGRSIPLAQLVPLTQVSGVRAYSLQRKDGVDQLTPPPEGIQLRVFDETFDKDGAFLDTAAVITHLDLVITTDTAMAHLAGAIGKEVWLLLQYVPDWRWGLTGETTPWYPRTRLYRQASSGDWTGLVQRVRQDLAERVKTKLEQVN